MTLEYAFRIKDKHYLVFVSYEQIKILKAGSLNEIFNYKPTKNNMIMGVRVSGERFLSVEYGTVIMAQGVYVFDLEDNKHILTIDNVNDDYSIFGASKWLPYAAYSYGHHFEIWDLEKKCSLFSTTDLYDGVGFSKCGKKIALCNTGYNDSAPDLKIVDFHNNGLFELYKLPSTNVEFLNEEWVVTSFHNINFVNIKSGEVVTLQSEGEIYYINSSDNGDAISCMRESDSLLIDVKSKSIQKIDGCKYILFEDGTSKPIVCNSE